jgi:heme-degrading monooxygenase HmoA
MWHGVVPEARAEEYLEYVNKTGAADLRSTRGNQGVFVFRRIQDGKAEFMLISLWDGYGSIKQFAGEDYEKARYYPEDEKFLLALEPHVAHYDVLVKP